MTTEEDWRAPGTPTPPSPVLTEAIGRVTSGLDALLAVAPASLSDEDVARLLDFATSCVDRAAGAVTAAVGEADHAVSMMRSGPGTPASGGPSGRC
jgi:hypothetical protein